MKIMVAIRIALRALRVNRMRSALTMLGVVIGVAAVIAMVAVGSGATARIQQQIEAIGSNLIMVIPGSITSNGIRLGSGAVVTLSEDDARAIAAECPSVSVVAPFVRGGVQVMYANNNWATSVLGTTPDYLVIRNQPVAQGNPFTVDDVNSAAKVALLGRTVAQNLFGGADPVGQTIRIKNVPFLVDGVLSAKGQTPTGQDQDDLILVPISTAKRNVTGASQANAGAVGSIMVQAAGPGAIDQAQSEVEELLRQRHRLQPDQDDDFTIRNLSEVFAAEESAAQAMSILLGAIASVSLLVGGIGIMNIMLVSVTERTREIGLRLADEGHPLPVPGGGRDTLGCWWGDRHRCRNQRFGADLLLRQVVDPGQPDVDRDGLLLLCTDRDLLRLLSCAQGCFSRSDRSVEGGVDCGALSRNYFSTRKLLVTENMP
jgi:putative ABC transport system permease protein